MIPIKVLDLALLLWHFWVAVHDEDIGNMDVQWDENDYDRAMNKKVMVPKSFVEGCLWAANMLHEKGKWWHPRGYSFDSFALNLNKDYKFDKIYNLLEKKK